jgi:hypothetical protein
MNDETAEAAPDATEDADQELLDQALAAAGSVRSGGSEAKQVAAAEPSEAATETESEATRLQNPFLDEE